MIRKKPYKSLRLLLSNKNVFFIFLNKNISLRNNQILETIKKHIQDLHYKIQFFLEFRTIQKIFCNQKKKKKSNFINNLNFLLSPEKIRQFLTVTSVSFKETSIYDTKNIPKTMYLVREKIEENNRMEFRVTSRIAKVVEIVEIHGC